MRTVKPLKIVVESLKRGRDVRPNLIRTNVDKAHRITGIRKNECLFMARKFVRYRGRGASQSSIGRVACL